MDLKRLMELAGIVNEYAIKVEPLVVLTRYSDDIITCHPSSEHPELYSKSAAQKIIDYGNRSGEIYNDQLVHWFYVPISQIEKFIGPSNQCYDNLMALKAEFEESRQEKF